MSAAAHTPGPWHFLKGKFNCDDKSNRLRPGSIVNEDDWYIAAIENAPHNEANARLIAAAPDLLAALKDISRFCDAVRVQVGMGKTQLARLDQARAAIAKAEGRS